MFLRQFESYWAGENYRILNKQRDKCPGPVNNRPFASPSFGVASHFGYYYYSIIIIIIIITLVLKQLTSDQQRDKKL